VSNNQQQNNFFEKVLFYSIIPFICALFLWNSFVMVTPGHVGVVVDMFGDSKGVESKELHVGVHFIPPWKSVYQFPVFEQNHTWEDRNAFSFQTSEGLAVSAEVGITYHLQAECIPIIFAKYRRGMDEITHTFIRNYIRDAINKSASKMKIEDLYGSGKEMFFDDVQTLVKSDLKRIGIEISRIYLIGRFHFPQTVVDALNSKIEAIQRAQQRENELREAEAQAKKEIAKAEGRARCSILQAEAESKANFLLSSSITPQLIQWQATQKWDGKLPQVVGNDSGIMIPMGSIN